MHLGSLQAFKECCVNLSSQSRHGAVLKRNLNARNQVYARQAAGLLADLSHPLSMHMANLMNTNTRTNVANLMHSNKRPHVTNLMNNSTSPNIALPKRLTNTSQIMQIVLIL